MRRGPGRHEPCSARESSAATSVTRAWAPLSAAALAFSLLHTLIDWHIGLFGPSGPTLSAVRAASAWLVASIYGWWAWCLVSAGAGSRSHLIGVVALTWAGRSPAMVWSYSRARRLARAASPIRTWPTSAA